MVPLAPSMPAFFQQHLTGKRVVDGFQGHLRLFPVLLFPICLLLAPPANAQPASCDDAPDLIFHHGTLLTMDEAHPRAEALAIQGKTLLAIGSNEDVLALHQPSCGTQVIDLHGLTLMPGFIDSHAHWFSWREHICSVTGETTYPNLEDIMAQLSAHGWTSIAELNFGRPDVAPEHLDNALDLDARGLLSVRLNGYWGTLDDGSLIDVLADAHRTPATFYSDRIRARGVKMYVDDPFGTTDILSQEETNQLVQAAHDAGWQVAAHAVNESAVEKILTAYEQVLGTASNEQARHRIEHAVKVNDNQLQRMRQKGIIASFQLLGPPDWPSQETFQTYISNTHPEWALRWKDFVDATAEGLHEAGSTDAPFNEAPCDYSPFRSIYQAVTRMGYLDRDHAPWELAQRLTVENSLRLLTIEGAYATFEEEVKGSLTPGKWADLVVLSDNPMAVATPEALLDINALLTIVGGTVEYCDATAPYDLCNPSETFPVDSVLVTASRYLPDHTPDLAFDGHTDTHWGAGDHAPQWIQVDMGKDVRIAGIDLMVEQFPEGQTVHEIWASSNTPGAPLERLHTFSQHTATDQLLSYKAPPSLAAYRYYRILSTESPSWISWKEITFHPPVATAMASSDPGIPQAYALQQNYPNPFNPVTTISFELPEPGPVSLTIYDVWGREIAQLEAGTFAAGRFETTWDASLVQSGIYFYRLETPSFTATRKLVVLK